MCVTQTLYLSVSACVCLSLLCLIPLCLSLCLCLSLLCLPSSSVLPSFFYTNLICCHIRTGYNRPKFLCSEFRSVMIRNRQYHCVRHYSLSVLRTPGAAFRGRISNFRQFRDHLLFPFIESPISGSSVTIYRFLSREEICFHRLLEIFWDFNSISKMDPP